MASMLSTVDSWNASDIDEVLKALVDRLHRSPPLSKAIRYQVLRKGHQEMQQKNKLLDYGGPDTCTKALLMENSDVTDLVKEWEEKNVEALQNLGALIRTLIEVVNNHACATIRYIPEDEKLIISREEERLTLPNDLYSKWANAMSSDGRRSNAGETCATGVTESLGKNMESMPSETEIQIGDDAFSVPLHKFPYLAEFVTCALPAKARHDPIPLFDVALKGVTSGYRQCFHLLNIDVSLFQQLCNTYELLRVDVLENQALEDVVLNVKAGKRDLDLEEKGDKRLARDSAFRLVYYVLTGKSRFARRESDQIFNAVLYVVSHPGTFKHRARNIVHAVYEDQFQCSVKQMAILHDWKQREDPEDDGETTASSSSEVYSYSDGYCDVSD